jgi:ATP-dependent Lhr-like helicase
LQFGVAIGALARRLTSLDAHAAAALLRDEHGLDENAAANLLAYLDDQAAASELPTDRTVVLERFVDEVGDWRVTLLTPFGGRVHAPWTTAVLARVRRERGIEIDAMWSDDGIVFRLPESDAPPDDAWFLPGPDEVEALVTRQLADTPLFAARFRENAARALLLPRRRPGQRTPLWVQRRRSSDLLAAAAEFSDFPILLETYRDCLQDVFDLGGLKQILRGIASRTIQVRSVTARVPSPFAASLMYGWVAEFLYEGDAPLAERRAQALSLDHAQLRALLGEPELRELLDAEAIETVEARLQRLDRRAPVKHADGLHDLLLALGDLTRGEIAARAIDGAPLDDWLAALLDARRVIRVPIGGDERIAAAEDVALLRDGLGVVPPPGLPWEFLEPAERPLDRLIERYARTHAPFTAAAVAERFALGVAPVADALARLEEGNRVLRGEFLPRGSGIEWCHPDVLRAIKQM